MTNQIGFPKPTKKRKKNKHQVDLRKYAKWEPCQVRIPMVCNHNPETTVLAHLNGSGLATKQPDLLGAHCCSACHALYDSRVGNRDYTAEQIKIMMYEGILRTIKSVIERGIVTW